MFFHPLDDRVHISRDFRVVDGVHDLGVVGKNALVAASSGGVKTKG